MHSPLTPPPDQSASRRPSLLFLFVLFGSHDFLVQLARRGASPASSCLTSPQAARRQLAPTFVRPALDQRWRQVGLSALINTHTFAVWGGRAQRTAAGFLRSLRVVAPQKGQKEKITEIAVAELIFGKDLRLLFSLYLEAGNVSRFTSSRFFSLARVRSRRCLC